MKLTLQSRENEMRIFQLGDEDAFYCSTLHKMTLGLFDLPNSFVDVVHRLIN